jgi:hypothetical protein
MLFHTLILASSHGDVLLNSNSLIPVLLIIVFCYAVWSDSEEALI